MRPASARPEVPRWRSRLSACVGGLALVLILLSIVGQGAPWTLFGGGICFVAMMLIDGSLGRWWRKEPH